MDTYETASCKHTTSAFAFKAIIPKIWACLESAANLVMRRNTNKSLSKKNKSHTHTGWCVLSLQDSTRERIFSKKGLLLKSQNWSPFSRAALARASTRPWYGYPPRSKATFVIPFSKQDFAMTSPTFFATSWWKKTCRDEDFFFKNKNSNKKLT